MRKWLLLIIIFSLLALEVFSQSTSVIQEGENVFDIDGTSDGMILNFLKDGSSLIIVKQYISDNSDYLIKIGEIKNYIDWGIHYANQRRQLFVIAYSNDQKKTQALYVVDLNSRNCRYVLSMDNYETVYTVSDNGEFIFFEGKTSKNTENNIIIYNVKEKKVLCDFIVSTKLKMKADLIFTQSKNFQQTDVAFFYDAKQVAMGYIDLDKKTFRMLWDDSKGEGRSF